MSYRYLPDMATADVAFEARADSLEELFRSAADATMNAMVADLAAIGDRESRMVVVEDRALDMLMFQLLQELIFYKDAEGLLLRIHSIEIGLHDDRFVARAEIRGEKLDAARHDLVVDVKAVTLHRFHLERTARGWEAVVILDV